jgi:IS30 family transposase
MTHITIEQRYSISALKQVGRTQAEIAKATGVSQSSISRELHRNKTDRGNYSAHAAQEMSVIRQERFHYPRKFSKEIEAHVRDKLEREQWSPEQIVGDALKHHLPIVSHERIYQYIRKDKQEGGKLYTHLRHQLKHRKRPVGGSVSNIPHRIAIHERPSIIDLRGRFGDWEMDLIQGATPMQYILTLVERTTRFQMMQRLTKGKHAETLAKAVVDLLRPYKAFVHSITTDNGCEFAKHEYICEKLQTTVYFTDPYSAWQKGAIENTNKLIRQYIKKNTNFDLLTDEQIFEIQKKLNRRPRKCIHWNKPVNLFYLHFS